VSDTKDVAVQKNEIALATDVSPGQLLSQAIDKGVPVETMERLMEMAEKWKANRAREAYYQALSEFQAECPVIHKTKVVLGKNGKERYRYAPLESIVQQVGALLREHGFSYTLKPETQDGQVKAVCVTHHIDGHSDQSEFTVPIDPDAYMNKQQQFASALTYAKRYAFCAAFGIMTGDEDDDAQSAEPVYTGGQGGQNSVRQKLPKEAEYDQLVDDINKWLGTLPEDQFADHITKARDYLSKQHSLDNLRTFHGNVKALYTDWKKGVTDQPPEVDEELGDDALNILDEGEEL
jgi:hypothetical protein